MTKEQILETLRLLAHGRVTEETERLAEALASLLNPAAKKAK